MTNLVQGRRRVLVRDLEARQAPASRCPRCGSDLLRQPDATLSCEACDGDDRDRVAARVLAGRIADVTADLPALRIVS